LAVVRRARVPDLQPIGNAHFCERRRRWKRGRLSQLVAMHGLAASRRRVKVGKARRKSLFLVRKCAPNAHPRAFCARGRAGSVSSLNPLRVCRNQEADAPHFDLMSIEFMRTLYHTHYHTFLASPAPSRKLLRCKGIRRIRSSPARRGSKRMHAITVCRQPSCGELEISSGVLEESQIGPSARKISKIFLRWGSDELSSMRAARWAR
jgi:hypothetical protein